MRRKTFPFHFLGYLIILVGILIKAILSVLYPLVPNTNEIQMYYFAGNKPLTAEVFLKEDQTTLEGEQKLFFVTTDFLYLFSRNFNHLLYLYKVPSIILLIFLSFLAFKTLAKVANLNGISLIVLAVIISSSFWLSQVSFNFIPETLSLLFAFLALNITLNKKMNHKISALFLFLSLIACAFTSPSGFIFSIFLLIFILFQERQNRFVVFLSIFSLGIFLLAILSNKNYIHNLLIQNTFIEKLRPSVLSDEINERQKIDYLSTNKKFILPLVVRKSIYNKPLLAINKINNHLIGLLDFEHLSFPEESYDELRLSGVLPKSKLPLLSFIEIPLVVLGIYLILQSRRKLVFPKSFILASLFPYLVFEKKDLVFSGIFFIPILLTIEILGFNFIYNKLKKGSLKFFTLVLIIPLYSMSLLNFYNLFFTKQEDYKRSDALAYLEISNWIKENQENYKKIFITNSFGPTHISTAFYLDIVPSKIEQQTLFAKNKTDLGFKIENLEFTSISPDLIENSKDAVFIGFPGEFLGPKENFNHLNLPKNFLLLKEILLNEELVYLMGNRLWFIKIL